MTSVQYWLDTYKPSYYFFSLTNYKQELSFENQKHYINEDYSIINALIIKIR